MLMRNYSSFLEAQQQRKAAATRRRRAKRQVNIWKGLKHFSAMFHAKKRPNRRNWRMLAKQYCTRYPGQPICRGGKVPNFRDVDRMIKGVDRKNIKKLLPKVPRRHIKDPLANVNKDLAEKARKHRRILGQIERENAAKLKQACQGGRCRQQPERALKRKDSLHQKLVAFEKRFRNRAAADDDDDTDDTADKVALRLDRTLQIKQALLEKAGLAEDVEAEDDGVLEGDLMLTEDQAELLLNQLDQADEGADPVSLADNDSDPDLTDEDTGDDGLDDGDNSVSGSIPSPPEGKKKRSAMFFEENAVSKWNQYSPVPFYLDESLDSIDKNDVRSGLLEIQQRTCIRFQELQQPSSGNYIHYYKIEDAQFCGLSYIGKTSPANPIYLSFGCPNSRGVAIHETMHALGVAHQHLRTDRDQYITINWQNVNPQQYDTFSVVDAKTYTSYGTPYAYDSIMHYSGYISAISLSTPTMIPKVNPAQNQQLLGQRQQMSQRDVELLTKMYCMPQCQDANVYCGVWALQGLCTSPNNGLWLQANCRKSCNLC